MKLKELSVHNSTIYVQTCYIYIYIYKKMCRDEQTQGFQRRILFVEIYVNVKSFGFQTACLVRLI